MNLVTERKQMSYWLMPCRMRKESLQSCINRVFDVDINEHTRRRNVVYAKHMMRFCLERLNFNEQITDRDRNTSKRDFFKYNLSDVARYCECSHSNILCSVKVVRNLIDTKDRFYTLKAQTVLNKIELGLIIFPEL